MAATHHLAPAAAIGEVHPQRGKKRIGRVGLDQGIGLGPGAKGGFGQLCGPCCTFGTERRRAGAGFMLFEAKHGPGRATKNLLERQHGGKGDRSVDGAVLGDADKPRCRGGNGGDGLHARADFFDINARGQIFGHLNILL